MRVEVSIQGSGNLLGEDITDVGTYWQAIKPGGVLYGEGHVVMMAKDGAVADCTGYGLGRPAGPPPAAHYGVCGLFHNVPDR